MSTLPGEADVTLPYAKAEEPATIAIGFLILRLVGIWFSLSLVSAAGFLAASFFESGSGLVPSSRYWVMAIPHAVLGICGLLLALFALELSQRLFRISGVAHFVPPPGETLLAILTVGMGVYLTASSIFDGFAWLLDGFVSIRRTLVGGGGGGIGVFVGLKSIAQLAIGLALFLRPNWVTAAWRQHSRMP